MAGIADAFQIASEGRDKGFAWIGRFLQNWSFIEAELRDAIGKALGLSKVQSAFVCANISFRDKINILKTAIELSPIYPLTDKAELKKTLNSIANHSPIRNMIAHDMFFPSDDGKTVSFFVIKAKGTFELPDVVWDESRFLAEYAQLSGWVDGVKEITRRLGRSRLVEALTSRAPSDNPTTLSELSELVHGGLLTLPVEEPPHSSPAPSTEGTDSQTPEEPHV